MDRFLIAQEYTYPIALNEIKCGKKCSHWMWFIFPQLRGLGTSAMAYKYGIAGLEEAKAYLAHPILSERLYEICYALLKHKDKTAYSIFGDIDAMKLCSSMTLFSIATENHPVFDEVLNCFFDGMPDEKTVKLIYG